MALSNIAWTKYTFNPWRGCTKVSPGCDHCYAESMSRRNPTVLGVWGDDGRRAIAAESYWRAPLKWNEEAAAAGRRDRVFCASLADVAEDRPELVAPRARLCDLIVRTRSLQWMLLTKRAENLARLFPREVLERCMVGTSTENQAAADARIPFLLQTPAAARFISAEPLLGPLDLGLSQATCGCCERIFSSRWVRINRRLTADFPLNIIGDRAGKTIEPGVHRATSNRHGALAVNDIGIRPSEFDTLPALDWVIVGGESGGDPRPFDLSWARSIIAQCQAAGVPVFVKQLGAMPYVSDLTGCQGGATLLPDGNGYELTLRDKKGGDPAEWPADIQVREFPQVHQ